jgi:hypothetical protein
MAVSIRYRGCLADLTRVSQLRHLLLEFADQANWQSLNLTGQDESHVLEIVLYPPGHCEPVFFLFDAQGRLHPPFDGRADRTDALWCSVKTEHGPPEAHIQIVDLLGRIRRNYIPDLEVRDEAEYWETRNIDRLYAARDFLGQQMALLARHLEQHCGGTLRNAARAGLRCGW